MGVYRCVTGSALLDTALQGGYESDAVTTIFGPAGAGKTTLCLLCLISVAQKKKKVIFIDTEGNFSLARLQQLCPDTAAVTQQVLLYKPTTFAEQRRAFAKLREYVTERIGLVIVDSFSTLYRLELGQLREERDEVFSLSRELGVQLSHLAEIARKKNIPVLITGQVHSTLEGDKVQPVGGEFLTYGSKCLLELQKLHGPVRRLIIRKHRSLPEQEVLFRIVQEGFAGMEQV